MSGYDFGLPYYPNGTVYWGIFLDASDNEDKCVGANFDPDIAGIGVRVQFTLQNDQL